MTVNVVAHFAHKSESAAWLSNNWLAWSERQLVLKAQFAELSALRMRLRRFEIRCAEALGRDYTGTQFSAPRVNPYDLNHLALRTIVARVAGNKPSGIAYSEACATYTTDHAAAWHGYETQRRQLKTLQALTKRFYQKFGYEQETSALASYLDDNRDEARWSWLDIFFAEREMPGNNRFVCPVCASVSKDGKVSDSSVTETGYVNPCCRNFDCVRYGEPLMSLSTFQAWLQHGQLETDGLAFDRIEYEAYFGWDARQYHQEQAESEHISNMTRSAKMRHLGLRAIERKCTRTDTQLGFYRSPSWQLIGPRVLNPGNMEPDLGAYVEATYSYLNHERVGRGTTLRVSSQRSLDTHRTVGRWEPESPEMWDDTANPHAIGVHSTGSLLVARH